MPHTQAECLSLFNTGVLNARARRSEYRLAVSRDLLVHPFVTRTFAHRAPEQTATA